MIRDLGVKPQTLEDIYTKAPNARRSISILFYKFFFTLFCTFQSKVVPLATQALENFVLRTQTCAFHLSKLPTKKKIMPVKSNLSLRTILLQSALRKFFFQIDHKSMRSNWRKVFKKDLKFACD